MTEKQPNHLLGENSPYLVQHAYNPVDWHPWGDAALTEAREKNKLLVISIGYAACHWCHVMEHESFEDDEVASAMNKDFISIKVDREERPDIDQVYMAAAYATTGRGGWPLNVIALPDQRPVFAGTYYSKKDWLHILNYFSAIHLSHPEDLVLQAAEIGQGMNRQLLHSYPPGPEQLEPSLLQEIYSAWEEDLDFVHGGTHGSPKFPMPANLGYLLEYGRRHKVAKALNYVELTLDQMAMGGICDQLGGGFSRYSVDARWHVPHFEKMLYDNAQLITLYAHASAATAKYDYKKVVEDAVAFAERELENGDGLFFASLDADSEGVEGKFYAWPYDEICKYLGDDAGMMLDYYSCTREGNWENRLNVLRKSMNDKDFAEKYAITEDELSACLDAYRQQLLTVRDYRIRPATDIKILTCWNALMISALVTAADALNKPHWLGKAIRGASFYRELLDQRNGKLWRSTRPGSLAIAGFLDDYCFLAKAFLDIYQATLDKAWLSSAEMLTGQIMDHFTAADGLFFRLSSDEEPSLVQETIELSDNVIPASNSQMAANLFILGHITGNDAYLQRSEAMLMKMIPAIKRNPAFHANWTALLAGYIASPVEISIVGENKHAMLSEFSGHYLPQVIFSGNQESIESGHAAGKTLIRICHRKTCFTPVETVTEAILLIETL